MSGIARKLSMLSQQGGPLVPAGTVVGFSGTLAEAAVLSDWVVCDGTSGTYNLTNRYIVGAGSTYALGDTGSGGGSGGFSSMGSHTAGTATALTNSGSSWYYNTNVSGGAHVHSVAFPAPAPAARQTLFIQASVQTSLPAKAVVWSTEPSAVDFSVDTTRYGRMLVGVNDDSRTDSGSDAPTFNISTTSSGAHYHGNVAGTAVIGKTFQYGAPGGYASAGGNHPHQLSPIVASVVPPFVGLVPMESSSAASAFSGIVVAYNGSVGSLPESWSEYTTLRDKFPRGAATAGGTGGVSSQAIVGTTSTSSWTHDHFAENYVFVSPGNTNYHAEKTASHSHTFAVNYSNLPNYTALHYITLT